MIFDVKYRLLLCILIRRTILVNGTILCLDFLYRDFVSLLPPEITEQILSYLSPATLLLACRVSKFWNKSIRSDKLTVTELRIYVILWWSRGQCPCF